jgi:hypothetical protein
VTKKLRRLFPKLFGDRYRIASPRTKKYNCIAWAAGKSDLWWEPPPHGYWPDGVLADGSIEAAVQLFESLGYTRADQDDVHLEDGVVKIAVYGDAAGYTHAARQLPNGKWISKIGKLQDIEHDTPDALTSIAERIGTSNDRAYGMVVVILEKREGPIVTAPPAGDRAAAVPD